MALEILLGYCSTYKRKITELGCPSGSRLASQVLTGSVFYLFRTESHYMAQTGHQLPSLLPLSPVSAMPGYACLYIILFIHWQGPGCLGGLSAGYFSSS